jgi:hypothetical protein
MGLHADPGAMICQGKIALDVLNGLRLFYTALTL